MQWQVDPIGGYGLATVVAVALLLLPFLVSPRVAGLSPSQQRKLLALRLAATLLLLIAWLRPMLISVRSEPLPEKLLVMIDASRSMSVEDSLNGESRWASVRRELEASQPAIARLAARQSIQAYTFTKGIAPLVIDTAGRMALPKEPTGKETALGQSLADLFTEEGSGRLMGVVLLSDGAQRAVPPRDLSPLAVARRLRTEGTPLFVFPLGDRLTADQADLAIEDLGVSDRAFAGTPLSVAARLRVDGFPNRQVEVRLLWENAEDGADVVDRHRIVTRPGVSVYPLDLTHTPTAAGEWKLTLLVDSLEGETLTGNNEASTFVTVREGGIRVLYLAGASRVGGAPGLEQRFVRASLATSPDVVVKRLAFNYRQPSRKIDDELRPGRVDVVVLDNLDSLGVDQRSWRRLAQLVDRGVGLAMIGGRHSFGPGGYRATALADLLPIDLGRAERQAFGQPIREDVHHAGPLRIVPTKPLGLRHPIMQLGSRDPLKAWLTLPPLDGANRLERSRLKPNAVVLAESSSESAKPGVPLIVAGQPGAGRVLALAGDTTWRWVLAGEGEAHRRFWRQVILWLAKKDDTSGEPVYIELGGRRVAPGASLDIAAGVHLPEDPTSQAETVRYEATVTLPSGQTKDLPLSGGRIRTTTALRETHEAGDYLLSVKAYADDRLLGTARSRFLVPRIDLELDRPAAEPDTLARLAETTRDAGGRLLAPEELPRLLEEMADREPQQKQEIVSKFTPWDTWPFLLLLVGLMSSEWWLRRRWGMP